MIRQLKEIWSLLNSEHRGVVYFACMAVTVAFLWTVAVAYGLGFAAGHDSAKTPHIPPTLELKDLIR